MNDLYIISAEGLSGEYVNSQITLDWIESREKETGDVFVCFVPVAPNFFELMFRRKDKSSD